ncbi:MAG TPA: hypothetical protein VIL86_10210 [Tepidisphaeraceae bacterium]|jgi:hypothetical protein
MPGRGHRIVAGIAWVVTSLIVWGAACNLFAYVVFMRLGNERMVKLPSHIDTIYNWTTAAGGVLIPTVVTMLALRGKLPGTADRSSKLRGFPIEVSRPSGPP